MTRFDIDSSAPRRLVRAMVGGPTTPVTVRIWMFTGALAIAAIGIYLALLHGRPTPPVTLAVPWPVIAAAFALAELKVVQVHFRRETHSFSLSEFPAVIGFFFLSPTDYLIAVLLGSTVAFVIGR